MKRQSKMVGEDEPIITMEDVKDLVHMKGTRLEKLAAVVARANQKLEAAAAAAPPTSKKLEAASPPAPPTSKKRSSHAGEGEASSSAPKKNKTTSNEAASLPPAFQRAIEDHARGRTVTAAPILVIQKKLFKTDVAANNNRLSIPISKIEDDFLTAEEKRPAKIMINVEVLGPSLEWVKGVKLSRWDMPKGNGSKTSSIYAINGAWKDIVQKNLLKEGTELQLWSFRLDHILHFAIVRLN